MSDPRSGTSTSPTRLAALQAQVPERLLADPRAQRLRSLAAGQRPHTVFITCADSRIAPHLLTGAEEGDLFVIRTAGNHLPNHGRGGEWASLDMALAGTPVTDIVICGHSGCAAMASVLQPATAPISAREHLAEVARDLGPLPDQVDDLARRHVRQQVTALRQRIVGEHPDIAVHGWFLDLTGPHLEILAQG